jgi:hypothetical protein
MEKIVIHVKDKKSPGAGIFPLAIRMVAMVGSAGSSVTLTI